jgi:biotin carboxyl carrier protein
MDGLHFPFRIEDERTRTLREVVKKSGQESGEHSVRAPIPGLISKIKVQEGQKIEQNQGLFILEAMKMENEIRSEFAGIIQKINVQEHSPVEKNQVLLIISAG